MDIFIKENNRYKKFAESFNGFDFSGFWLVEDGKNNSKKLLSKFENLKSDLVPFKNKDFFKKSLFEFWKKNSLKNKNLYSKSDLAKWTLTFIFLWHNNLKVEPLNLMLSKPNKKINNTFYKRRLTKKSFRYEKIESPSFPLDGLWIVKDSNKTCLMSLDVLKSFNEERILSFISFFQHLESLSSLYTNQGSNLSFEDLLELNYQFLFSKGLINHA